MLNEKYKMIQNIPKIVFKYEQYLVKVQAGTNDKMSDGPEFSSVG